MSKNWKQSSQAWTTDHSYTREQHCLQKCKLLLELHREQTFTYLPKKHSKNTDLSTPPLICRHLPSPYIYGNINTFLPRLLKDEYWSFKSQSIYKRSQQVWEHNWRNIKNNNPSPDIVKVIITLRFQNTMVHGELLNELKIKLHISINTASLLGYTCFTEALNDLRQIRKTLFLSMLRTKGTLIAILVIILQKRWYE